MRVHEEVSEALAEGRPVVALESTIISHGLPRPRNLDVAREIEDAVRAAGAVPATIALVAGEVRIGLDDPALEAIAGGEDVVKCGVRDLAPAVARRAHGATTVAATSVLAVRAGIGTFATGGLGGVHREARETWDESADLGTLAQTPITVVCAGVKSILDVGATLERLETLGIPVLGYRTQRYPGFYVADSGFALESRIESAADAAAVARARDDLGLGAALLVANPIAVAEQLDPQLHDRVLAEALAAADAAGVNGHDTTPFLLDFVQRATGGRSLEVNLAVYRGNARLGAEIARALAG